MEVERYNGFPPGIRLPQVYKKVEAIPGFPEQIKFAISRVTGGKSPELYPDIELTQLAVYSLGSRKIYLGDVASNHQSVANIHENGLWLHHSNPDYIEALSGYVFRIKGVGNLAIMYDLLEGVDVSWIRDEYPLLMNHSYDWMFEKPKSSYCVASKHSPIMDIAGEVKYVSPPDKLDINFRVK